MSDTSPETVDENYRNLLTPNLDDHVSEFVEAIEDDYADRTVENYAIEVRGFFRRSIFGLEPDFSEDSHVEAFVDEIGRVIESHSMSYGVKKYVNWRNGKVNDPKVGRTITWVLDRIDISRRESSNDVEPIDKRLNRETIATILADSKEYSEPEVGREAHTAIALMYEGALRISDVSRLEWQDVFCETFGGQHLNPDEYRISKNRSKSSVPGIISVMEKTHNNVISLYAKREPDEDDRVFFPDKTEKQSRGLIRRAFNHARDKNDIIPEEDSNAQRVTSHFLRASKLIHMGERLLYDKGWSYHRVIERLRKYARHKNQQTTENNYVQPLRDRRPEELPDDVVNEKLDY